jgi:formate hydrogenlyase transcriptional activator
MHWSPEVRYKILLKLNNAVIAKTTRGDLFQAVATELRKHFTYDRLSINLYDPKTQSISYFTNADGISPRGISTTQSRPLAKGSIAQMVIDSGQPVIIDDLTSYSDHSSIGAMVNADLKSTMAFPLILRDQILGSLHFSFRSEPDHISELTEVLVDVSRQIAIAVENMLAHEYLKEVNTNLIREKRFLLSTANQQYQQDSFIFKSHSMTEIMNLIDQIADTDAPVLLTGETGTGKDYLARHIHNLSHRKENMFVKTNCPGLASSLFESELFGHSKGAFTGAATDRIGRFEMAHGGTIFLDEIGELPVNLQAKLLHVLQDRSFERVGDSNARNIDFRIISATNKDLGASIKSGTFRRDLYYRLNVFTIEVPPLRDRVEDIDILVNNIIHTEAQEMKRPAPKFTPEALQTLKTYSWPGNIRELKNFLKRMIILKSGRQISSIDMKAGFQTLDTQPCDDGGFLTLAEAEKRHIEQALKQCRGSLGGTNGAAALLGIPRSTLQYRIKKLGITPVDHA